MKARKNKGSINLKKISIISLVVICLICLFGYLIFLKFKGKTDYTKLKNPFEDDIMVYEGYSEFDLYQNRVYNSVPYYTASKKLKEKNKEEFNVPFSYKDGYNSKITVNENKNNYSYEFSSDYEKQKQDVLTQHLLSFKKKTNDLDRVYRIEDGYLVLYSFSNKSTSLSIDMYDNEFKYLWTYNIRDDKYFILKDFVEIDDNYHFLISYNNGRAKYLIIDKSGNVVNELKLSYDVNKFLGVDENKVFFSSFDTFAYYDLKTKKAVKEKLDFKLPSYKKVNYVLDGYSNGSYYFTSEDGESSKKSDEQYDVLYKINTDGKVLNSVNLREKIDSKYKDNIDYTYQFRTYLKDDRIFVEYDAFYIENGAYNGLLVFDLDLKLLKNFSTDEKSNLAKELNVKEVANISYYQYKEGNIYLSLPIKDEDGGFIYVIYDKNLNKTLSKRIDGLFSDSGTLLISYFDKEEIVHYNEYEFNNKSYLKLSNINFENIDSSEENKNVDVNKNIKITIN